MSGSNGHDESPDNTERRIPLRGAPLKSPALLSILIAMAGCAQDVPSLNEETYGSTEATIDMREPILKTVEAASLTESQDERLD